MESNSMSHHDPATTCRFCGRPEAELLDRLGRRECADTADCQTRELAIGLQPHAAEYAKGPADDPDGPICVCGRRVFDPIHRDGWAPSVRAERDARLSKGTRLVYEDLQEGPADQPAILRNLPAGRTVPLALPADVVDRAEAECRASAEESAAVAALTDPKRLGVSVGTQMRSGQFDAPVVILSTATNLMNADGLLAKVTAQLRQTIAEGQTPSAGGQDISVLVEAVTRQTVVVRALRIDLEKRLQRPA